MPSTHTLKTIEDLKKAGLDTSSIEAQLRNDPIVDKQVSGIIDGGILRLADYTRFAGEYKEKNDKLQAQIAELASRQGAIGYLTKDSEAYKDMAEHINSLEKALIDADVFDEDSVKNVHTLSQEKLQKLISDSTTNVQSPVKKEGENNMPTDFDPNKYIDVDTHKTSMANLAMGTIAMTAKINRHLDQTRSLGVDITPELEKKLDENLMAGLTSGKDVPQIFNETFGLDAIRATKAEETRQAELKAAKEEGYAQAKKEDGVPARQITRIASHPILDSKTIGRGSDKAVAETYTDEKGQIDPTKLPRNEKGEVERYKLRGSREDRLARAAASHEKVMEIVAADPLYVP